MPNILTHAGTTIVLSPDLRWSDELTWSPVVQAKERSITGAWIVDAAARAGGRSITLQGDATSGLLTLGELRALRAAAAIPGAELALTTYDGVTRAVYWDHGDAEESTAIAAEPFILYSDPENADFYCSVKLRFIEKG